MSSLLPEAPRDQAESGFTRILRRVFSAEPDIRALIFVDRDGECVDYCSALAPYDVKVVGAHMQVVVAGMRESLERLMTGALLELHVYGEHRDFIARRLDDEYLLVAVVRGGMTDETVLRAVEETVVRLRHEANLAAPWWDAAADAQMEVKVRTAVGWEFAPTAVEYLGHETPILDVLGRWQEEGGAPGGELICFRVRVAEGECGELTLAYDPRERRWFRW
jgi:predicted regulator of Ras-like GTPase activity (Roadblock/LC7/MglB family)